MQKILIQAVDCLAQSWNGQVQLRTDSAKERVIEWGKHADNQGWPDLVPLISLGKLAKNHVTWDHNPD